MISNKNIVRKVIYVILFITFFGVIIGGLVGMHLRLIYDIEFVSDNQFIKPIKKDTKKLLKSFNSKELNHHYFLRNDYLFEIKLNLLFSHNFFKTFDSYKIIFPNRNVKLRAPPAF